MIGPLLPEVQRIINLDPQRSMIGPIQLDMLNDSYYALHSYIKSNASAGAMKEAYNNAFLKTGRPEQAVRGCLQAISRLLQQPQWPYYSRDTPCTRPNAYNRADLTINYVEALGNQPEQFMGCKLFSFPLLVLEVEGCKDKVGKIDQQAKAMREVLVALSVMPECYLIFVYPSTIEIWKALRNVEKCCIDVTAEQIHINETDRTLRRSLDYFVGRVLEIIARQVVHILPIAEVCIGSIRNARSAMATGHTLNLWTLPCCDECFVLDNVTSAAGLRAGFPRIDLACEGDKEKVKRQKTTTRGDDGEEDMAQ